LNCSGFEASPDLEAGRVDDNGVVHIEEAGSFSNLLEGGLTESLLDNDVE